MKKFLPLLFVAIVALVGCGKKVDPTEYNNTIVGEQSKIVNHMLEMTDQINKSQFKEALVGIDGSIAQCDSSIKKVSELEPYEGDAKFRDAAVDLFKFYKKILDNEYRKMLVVLNKPEITMEDVDQIDKLTGGIEAEETKYDNAMKVAQEEFAKKYDVKIVDNTLQEKIDKMGE